MGSVTSSPRTAISLEALLLREQHHRFSNEIAAAIATLSIAARRCAGETTGSALGGAMARLQAFADTQHQLRRPSEIGSINLGVSLRQLCEAIVKSRLAPAGIALTYREEDVWIEIERGWRVRLIVCELVTNAVKHAFLERGNQILVSISCVSDQVVCHVGDDGRWLDRGSRGDGSEIVAALVDDLNGRLERTCGSPGTHFRMTFPLTDASQEERA